MGVGGGRRCRGGQEGRGAEVGDAGRGRGGGGQVGGGGEGLGGAVGLVHHPGLHAGHRPHKAHSRHNCLLGDKMGDCGQKSNLAAHRRRRLDSAARPVPLLQLEMQRQSWSRGERKKKIANLKMLRDVKDG